MRFLSRTVWILSLVSLFTDMASEMLYPIMPLYLRSIGFTIAWIGLLEGLAEATAGLSKGYFGNLSDASGKRAIFVRFGYSLSALSKPMLALFTWPLWIFFARTLDRLGKGIRTGARDALLSDEATNETKGRIFGFHRGMDTLGAVLGPSIALLYLRANPEQYKPLFYLAFFPGILAIAASLLIRERRAVSKKPMRPVSFLDFLNYWKRSPSLYRKTITGFLIFALFNSSDVFLLLKAKSAGLSEIQVILVYIFYNIVYAGFSYPLGSLGDRVGLKKVFLLGLAVFSAVYIGMALTDKLYFILALFFLYGIYAASNEGIIKAWISNITDKKDTATAIGTYSGFQSICTLLASTIAGVLWQVFGAAVTFSVTGIISLFVLAYMSRMPAMETAH